METLPMFKYVVMEEVCGFYSRLDFYSKVACKEVGNFYDVRDAYELKRQLENEDADDLYEYNIYVITEGE